MKTPWIAVKNKQGKGEDRRREDAWSSCDWQICIQDTENFLQLIRKRNSPIEKQTKDMKRQLLETRQPVNMGNAQPLFLLRKCKYNKNAVRSSPSKLAVPVGKGGQRALLAGVRRPYALQIKLTVATQMNALCDLCSHCPTCSCTTCKQTRSRMLLHIITFSQRFY